MINVALYTDQPILAAGLEAVIAGLDDFSLTIAATGLGPFVEHVRAFRPDVILIEASDSTTFGALRRLRAIPGAGAIVLWVSSASVEFVSQALALGVRGILHHGLPVEMQIKCLRKVAKGELWVDQALCNRILASDRIMLTPRDRDLLGLLAQGLKNKEIAGLLGLSEGTVKVYLSRLLHKVRANDRFELALFALKNFFAEMPDASQTGAKSAVRPRATEYLPAFVNVDRSGTARKLI